MVKLISTISKGTRMDQIYLPKLRPPGFAVGETVEIVPTIKEKKKFFTYGVAQLEPIKNIINDEIFDYFENVDNVLITGSFLEKGFEFSDIDILLIDGPEVDSSWKDYFERKLGVNLHFLSLSRESLLKGLGQDPLFQMMVSRYISKKREIFRFNNKFNYKLLDLHLLKSKALVDNFDFLTGKEKYNLVRNMIAIRLFLSRKKLSRQSVDKEIDQTFGTGTADSLRENMVKKEKFIPLFRKIFNCCSAHNFISVFCQGAISRTF